MTRYREPLRRGIKRKSGSQI